MLDAANKLKKLRVSKGISQRELARRVGVSNGTVSMMEKGRTDPTLGLLMKVLEGHYPDEHRIEMSIAGDLPVGMTDYTAVGAVIAREGLILRP